MDKYQHQCCICKEIFFKFSIYDRKYGKTQDITIFTHCKSCISKIKRALSKYVPDKLDMFGELGRLL